MNGIYDFSAIQQDAQDYLVAVCVATEVPPVGLSDTKSRFTLQMIEPAIKAVVECIYNRASNNQFPDTPIAVVLQPRQFSAVCREEYWRLAVCGEWQPNHVARCLQFVQAYRTQPWAPLASGVLYYYSPVSMQPKWSAPAWASKLTEINVPAVNRDFFRWFKP